ncbi:HEAT repeat domain-containing protein [Streptomyces anulatus]|uniref:HEAT repeat domain-containing protein n=2 Tax=Streptomyces TaxID=1883 RepID=UPI0009A059B4
MNSHRKKIPTSTVDLLRSVARAPGTSEAKVFTTELYGRADLGAATLELLSSGSRTEKLTALSTLSEARKNSTEEVSAIALSAMRDNDLAVRRLGSDIWGATLSGSALSDALHSSDDAVAIGALEHIFRTGITAVAADVTPFLRSGSPRARLLAVRILSKTRDLSVCPPLADLLFDSAPHVRRSAMRAMAENCCTNAIDALRQIWRLSDQESDRFEALSALSVLVPHDMENLLIEALSDPSENVRNWAGRACRDRTTPHMLRCLLPALEADPSARVRAAVATGLAGSRTEVAIVLHHLGRSATSDPSTAVRVASVRALSTFGEEAIPHTLPAVEDPESRVRRAAVMYLRNMKNEQASAALRSLGRTEDSEEVRAEIADNLSDLPPEFDRRRARPLHDPAGDSTGFTTWLSDLTRYPESNGITFYATGRCTLKIVESESITDEEGLQFYPFTVDEQGRLCIEIPDSPQLRTAFCIETESAAGVYGEIRPCYKLTLDNSVPLLSEVDGPTAFYVFRT